MKHNISLNYNKPINDAIELLQDKLIVVKIGGSILNTETLIENLCKDLSLLKNLGMKIIVVHGGSKAIQEGLAQNNISSEFIDGLRVTSQAAMRIIEMVLCGHVNKILVRKLNAIGINALGLSGTDSNMLLCDYYSKQHEYVGNIKAVNITPITHTFSDHESKLSAIPVIAPVGVDAKGNALNINADWAASAIAAALNAHSLIFITDQHGVYDQQKNVIKTINAEELQILIDKEIVSNGMLVKVRSALNALKNSVKNIHIINGQTKYSLISCLCWHEDIGTTCKK